ncbi:MAG: hypothetical protein R3D52_02600, partial [Xanthobacteraceae bacterium]
KKAWMLVVVAAIGNTLNNTHSVKVDELWLSDTTEMKNRTAYVLPAALAKSLQKEIKSNKISLEDMFTQVNSKLSKRNIPKQ